MPQRALNTQKVKKSKLEKANDLYLMAFEIKKTKFAQAEPHLTEAEVNQKTIEYFKNLKQD